MAYEDQLPHIKRRVEFLLNEALEKSPRDQAITFVMRVISNYVSVGIDAGSYSIKQKNLMVSRLAYEELLVSPTFKGWAENTVNEHPLPLKHTWDWLCNDCDKLTPIDVWHHFESNPMITVLKKEDNLLNEAGLRSSSKPDRYKHVGIEIIKLKKMPYESWKEIH